MRKGSRVRVATGRQAVGVIGTVFWVGKNRFDDGKRAGIEGDDGQTYWIDLKHLEPTTEPAPVLPLPPIGARVRFEFHGVEVEGVVFWTGPSKEGPGDRLGIHDPGGGAHWIDARKATVVGTAS